MQSFRCFFLPERSQDLHKENNVKKSLALVCQRPLYVRCQETPICEMSGDPYILQCKLKFQTSFPVCQEPPVFER